MYYSRAVIPISPPLVTLQLGRLEGQAFFMSFDPKNPYDCKKSRKIAFSV